MDWTGWAMLVGVFGTLVGVPLGAVTLYLKSLRDYQLTRARDFDQRISHLDESTGVVARQVRDFERDYTTKEEWLRESMHARRQLEKLTELVTRIEAQMENGSRGAKR